MSRKRARRPVARCRPESSSIFVMTSTSRLLLLRRESSMRRGDSSRVVTMIGDVVSVSCNLQTSFLETRELVGAHGWTLDDGLVLWRLESSMIRNGAREARRLVARCRQEWSTIFVMSARLFQSQLVVFNLETCFFGTGSLTSRGKRRVARASCRHYCRRSL